MFRTGGDLGTHEFLGDRLETSMTRTTAVDRTAVLGQAFEPSVMIGGLSFHGACFVRRASLHTWVSCHCLHVTSSLASRLELTRRLRWRCFLWARVRCGIGRLARAARAGCSGDVSPPFHSHTPPMALSAGSGDWSDMV